jgi:hypothetical protein
LTSVSVLSFLQIYFSYYSYFNLLIVGH